MKYCGGTFSGHKSVICAEEITVVGHRCGYDGRKPEEARVKIVRNWGPCKDVSDVQSFLGTIRVCQVFIKESRTFRKAKMIKCTMGMGT